MIFSKTFKTIGSAGMCVILSNVPAVVMAEPGMIPTHVVVEELTRTQAQQKVHDFLSRSDVQQLLIERGLSTDEALSRVASLSETELRQLSGQIEQARAGGDILVAILIVVLIIFLIKRI